MALFRMAHQVGEGSGYMLPVLVSGAQAWVLHWNGPLPGGKQLNAFMQH